MHPFPPQENLSFLQGLELRQVVLDPHSVAFVLEGVNASVRLVAEGGFDYIDTDGKAHVYDIQHEWPPVVFHPLVRSQDCVTGVDVSDWRLALTFASGRKLIIHSEEGPYESGQIFCGDQLIVF